MIMRWLRIGEVAKKAGVPLPKASEILNGKRIDPENLEKLRSVIEGRTSLAGK